MAKDASEDFIIFPFFLDICSAYHVSVTAVTVHVNGINSSADTVTLGAPMPLHFFQFLVGEITRGVPIIGVAFIARYRLGDARLQMALPTGFHLSLSRAVADSTPGRMHLQQFGMRHRIL